MSREILITETILNTEVENTEVQHESTLYAEPIGHIGSFTITNALLTSWIVVFIIAILVLILRFKKFTFAPTKVQNFLELIIDGALNLCDQVTGNRAISIKIFPIVFSLFIFVLINNWMGILPGVGAFGQIVNEAGHNVFVPYLRGATADVNTTIAIALVSVIISNIFGIIALGTWKSINKYIKLTDLAKIRNFRNDPTILIVAPVMFFVGLLEAIGEIAKVASLTFRLYGNVFAGEVLLASMSAILPFILPIPFVFMEFFVGILQAFIFAMLTLVYFSIQTTDHDEHQKTAHHNDEKHLAPTVAGSV